MPSAVSAASIASEPREPRSHAHGLASAKAPSAQVAALMAMFEAALKSAYFVAVAAPWPTTSSTIPAQVANAIPFVKL